MDGLVETLGTGPWLLSSEAQAVDWLPGFGSSREEENAADCLKIKKKMSPRRIPHYLLSSLGTENYPYLLRLVGENRCDRSLVLVVRYLDYKNVLMNEENDYEEIPMGEFDITIEPDFTVSTSRPEDFTGFEILWSVEDPDAKDSRKKELATGEIDLELGPPYTLDWGLDVLEAKGGARPLRREEFVAASLAAWTRMNSPALEARALACRRAPGVGQSQDSPIKSCYEGLFQGESAVPLNDVAIRESFGKKPQRIRPVPELLERGTRANRLEAALLFIAVFNNQRDDLVDPELLLIVANSEEGKGKTVFVAWDSGTGAGREAVEMADLDTRSFEQNVQSSSSRVNALFADHADMEKALAAKKTYVHGDKSVIAVNPWAAAEMWSFEAASLP